MATKIWMVTCYTDFDGHGLCGVYTSRKRANEAVAAMHARRVADVFGTQPNRLLVDDFGNFRFRCGSSVYEIDGYNSNEDFTLGDA